MNNPISEEVIMAINTLQCCCDSYGDYRDFLASSSKLCDKAKEILIGNLIDGITFQTLVYEFELTEGLTPIEQIFLVSYYSILNRIGGGLEVTLKRCDGRMRFGNYPLTVILYEYLCPQKKVEINGKNYIPDFELSFDRMLELEDLKYIVELDGFEYHSKKKQMNYDYERERDLLKAGYKIVRYTGSQVYNEPLKCALEFVELVISDIMKKANIT